jgi:UDP-N-acetylglucosamine/UDP-N-acetylgalactosamine diphosphorylase
MNEQLLHTLTEHNQQHLLRFWDSLDATQRASLAAQIGQIDFGLIARLFRARGDQTNFRDLVERSQPPPAFRLDTAQNRFTPQQAQERGTAALRAGQIGVILVAGGQGTRLGFDHPKGMFLIGPVSGRTLFQIHVEKMLAAARRYGVRIPLYLMTSPATHDETLAFFAQHGRFGLPADDLQVFCQGTMPAVDEQTGQVLLERPDRIATSPDGHGGMLAALRRSGALEDMRRRGIEHLFYFQVDNPLVDICSPEFLGYHLLSESEMSSQVVAKRDPLDRLGNVIQVDGRLMVVEYSDLSDDLAGRRNADGSLWIWAGSIAVHAFSVAILERMAGSSAGLPFHFARKKVAHVDERGNRVEPKEPNAIKFERFIFDLMPAAANAIVVEIDPAEGFAPLKNAPGAAADTCAAVQAQMIAQHRRWLEAAGAAVAESAPVEICPLWALDAAETAAKIAPGTRVEKARFFA